MYIYIHVIWRTFFTTRQSPVGHHVFCKQKDSQSGQTNKNSGILLAELPNLWPICRYSPLVLSGHYGLLAFPWNGWDEWNGAMEIRVWVFFYPSTGVAWGILSGLATRCWLHLVTNGRLAGPNRGNELWRSTFCPSLCLFLRFQWYQEIAIG